MTDPERLGTTTLRDGRVLGWAEWHLAETTKRHSTCPMAILSSIQVPDATVAKLDAVAQRLSKKAPGAKVSRADVIRLALERVEELVEVKGRPTQEQLDGWAGFLEIADANRTDGQPNERRMTRADYYADDDDEG